MITGEEVWTRYLEVLNLNILGQGTGSVCPFPVDQVDRLCLGFVPPALALVQLMLLALGYKLWAKCRQNPALVRSAAAIRRVVTLRHGAPPSSSGAITTRMHFESATSAPHQTYIPYTVDQGFRIAPFMRTATSLTLVSFNVVLKTCFQFFDCVDIPGVGSFVQDFPAVSCDSDAYKRLRPVFLALLMGTLATPLVFLAVLTRRAFVGQHGAARLKRYEGLRLAGFRRYWGALYEPFKLQFYFWTVYSLLRRTSLVAVAVYVDERSRSAGSPRNSPSSRVVPPGDWRP